MAGSLDPATQNLRCGENSNACFDDLDCTAPDDSGISHQNINANRHNPNLDNYVSESSMFFPVQSEENVRLMVEKEGDHLPKDDYPRRVRSGDLDLSLRREALVWILKAHSYFGFGPLSFYLSINYLDRFLAVHELPSGKAWPMQLLAVACLSIAAKLVETEVPTSIDLQVGGPKFVFEAKTIRRMEFMVLNKLRWKMQAVTPFSFIDYFLHKINNEQHLSESSISRSIQLILSTTRVIDFLQFKPSEIAAAVAIFVSREAQAIDIDKAISCFAIVEKERVLKCLEMIKNLSLIGFSANLGSKSAPIMAQSPTGVLDASCWSLKSDELTGGSCPNHSSHNSPKAKKSQPDKPDGNSKS